MKYGDNLILANTTGATYDVRLYLTIRNALRLLYGLVDAQTGQEIDAPRVVLMVRGNVIEWDLQRVINGQLEKFGTPVENRAGLAINEIWKYKGDTITVGPKPTVYPGVPVNTAYLFVTGPDGAPSWTLNKRQLAMDFLIYLCCLKNVKHFLLYKICPCMVAGRKQPAAIALHSLERLNRGILFYT
ncbi:hypothetical protein LCGC14_2144200, partial [marine sediment metagenome]